MTAKKSKSTIPTKCKSTKSIHKKKSSNKKHVIQEKKSIHEKKSKRAVSTQENICPEDHFRCRCASIFENDIITPNQIGGSPNKSVLRTEGQLDATFKPHQIEKPYDRNENIRTDDRNRNVPHTDGLLDSTNTPKQIEEHFERMEKQLATGREQEKLQQQQLCDQLQELSRRQMELHRELTRRLEVERCTKAKLQQVYQESKNSMLNSVDVLEGGCKPAANLLSKGREPCKCVEKKSSQVKKTNTCNERTSHTRPPTCLIKSSVCPAPCALNVPSVCPASCALKVPSVCPTACVPKASSICPPPCTPVLCSMCTPSPVCPPPCLIKTCSSVCPPIKSCFPQPACPCNEVIIQPCKPEPSCPCNECITDPCPPKSSCPCNEAIADPCSPKTSCPCNEVIAEPCPPKSSCPCKEVIITHPACPCNDIIIKLCSSKECPCNDSSNNQEYQISTESEVLEGTDTYRFSHISGSSPTPRSSFNSEHRRSILSAELEEPDTYRESHISGSSHPRRSSVKRRTTTNTQIEERASKLERRRTQGSDNPELNAMNLAMKQVKDFQTEAENECNCVANQICLLRKKLEEEQFKQCKRLADKVVLRQQLEEELKALQRAEQEWICELKSEFRKQFQIQEQRLKEKNLGSLESILKSKNRTPTTSSVQTPKVQIDEFESQAQGVTKVIDEWNQTSPVISKSRSTMVPSSIFRSSSNEPILLGNIDTTYYSSRADCRKSKKIRTAEPQVRQWVKRNCPSAASTSKSGENAFEDPET